MSPTTLLLLASLLLASPWLLGPWSGRSRPEMHGFVLVLWWLNRLYCALWHDLELEESDAVPAEGPALLVSNHTCGIDHMLLQSMTRRALGFMIAQELYDGRISSWFCDLVGCIPVRRDGRDLSATRAAVRAIRQGRVVPIFPEGRIFPTSGRVIAPGKPGAAFLALKARAPVIPAYICGTPETNEIGPSVRTPSHARVAFGPPIDLSDLSDEGEIDRETLEEATRRIMSAIVALRDRGPFGGTSPAGPAAARPLVEAAPEPVAT
jgi:1-acyl-sn-glycerol-3-phosphate acyltransferase